MPTAHGKLTPAELKLVQRLRCEEGVALRTIAARIGVSTNAICNACKKNDWRLPEGVSHDNRWSKEDEDLVREHYETCDSVDDLISMLSRKATKKTVSDRASLMGLNRKSRKPAYDPEEIRKLYTEDGVTIEAIAKKIGVSRTRVGNVCRDNGWVRKTGKPRLDSWSQEDDKVVKELWEAGAPIEDIIPRLSMKRTKRAVKQRARILRAKRPALSIEDTQPVKEPSVRTFSRIEVMRMRQFFQRGDGVSDVARQLRCAREDIQRVEGFVRSNQTQV